MAYQSCLLASYQAKLTCATIVVIMASCRAVRQTCPNTSGKEGTLAVSGHHDEDRKLTEDTTSVGETPSSNAAVRPDNCRICSSKGSWCFCYFASYDGNTIIGFMQLPVLYPAAKMFVLCISMCHTLMRRRRWPSRASRGRSRSNS